MTQPRFIYIAGPYTGTCDDDKVENVRRAIEAGQRVLDAGFIPFIPHLYHYWDVFLPGHYEQWMTLDFAWLGRCDAIVRLPGDTPGADREVARAAELGLPVFQGVAAFLAVGPATATTP